MEKSLKGCVAIIPFPFSDLTGSKKRPALIVADWNRDDVILSQITSIAHKDSFAIDLTDKDFSEGGLQMKSFIRPNKLFTADKTILLKTIGTLTDKKMKEISKIICDLISK